MAGSAPGIVFSHRTDGRLGASICSLTRQYDGSTNDITTFLARCRHPRLQGAASSAA